MLSIDSPLIDQLDFAEAVRQESAWVPSLVPATLVNWYAATAADNVETVAGLLTEMARAGISPQPADVLAASKWRYGRRPVALMPLAERVMYRAVVNYIRDDLPPLVRRSEEHWEFLNAPLMDGGNGWIVVTDLANFYSTIPTRQLGEELIARTGRWQPNEWLQKFWSQVSPRGVGIPQVNEPSDWIAEAYADELHRRLLRRGVRSWRYADDFRLAAKSQSGALAALETFDEEARSLGLFVNERKTYTLSRKRYQHRHKENLSRIPRIVAGVKDELKTFDSYSMEPVDADDAEVLEEAATRMLQIWRDERSADAEHSDVATDIEVASLVGRAFQVLDALHNPTGIEYCSEVMGIDPQLTPVICRYLISLPEEHNFHVLQEIKRILAGVSLTKWQRLWVTEVLASESVSPKADNQMVSWLKSGLSDSSEYVRSQTLWALGRNWSLDRDVWENVSTKITRLGGPLAAAALRLTTGADEKEKSRLLQSDKLDRQVYQWVSTRGLIPNPF